MGYRDRWLPVALLLIVYFLFTQYDPRNFAVSTYKYETLRDLESQLSTSLEKSHPNGTDDFRPLCPAIPEFGYNAIQSIQRNSSFWSMEDVDHFDEKNLAQTFNLQPGGVWRPQNCNAVHHVGIVVPYRDRSVQLRKFVIYMHKFLQLQMIHYKIIVVEQKDDLPFNRGKLLNAGFVEASKHGWYECFIFHDIDLLPESVYNIYGCSHRPRHMSAVVNTFRYTLQYVQLFGGVVAVTKNLFNTVNGFSNNFFGWGGEDDDLYSRIKSKKVEVIRLSPAISSYRMLPHKKAPANSARFEKLSAGKERYELDGLNSLKYSISNHIASPLYTLIQVKL